MKRIWNDAVWSKVIAGIILAALLPIAGMSWKPIGVLLLSASSPNWLLALLVIILICESAILLTAGRPRVHITPVGETDIREDKTPNREYPLKAYRIMRNGSTRCADVRVADYRASSVSLKKFVTDILQVKLREWCPDKEGVERVGVLPGQQFRAWVGTDEKKFTKEQLERLRGQIGTLVLIVNGQRVDIPL